MENNNDFKRFLETYEYKLKSVRDAYLNDKENDMSLDSDYLLISLFEFLSIIFVLLLLYILQFSSIGYVISFIVLIILCVIHSMFSVKLMDSKSRYIFALRKRGYKNIEAYEKELKKYLTGKDGYYNTLLKELELDYNITDKTAIIEDIYGIEYYIFVEDGCLKLLSRSTEARPKIKIYALENVRYYREDDNNYVVLKTNVEEYRFVKNSIVTLRYLLPKKSFDVVKNYHPEDYINDFEIYMHAFRNKIDSKNNHYKDLFVNSLIYAICFTIIFIILGILYNILVDYRLFIIISTIIMICLLFSRIKKCIRYKILMYSDKDIMYEINHDMNAVNHFYELKTALKISDKYNTIMSVGGYPYIVWVSNNYFHLFLDVAYYNAVYVVVGLNNDIRYKVKNNETVLKLKNKVFHFDKDANKVLEKLLGKDRKSSK